MQRRAQRSEETEGLPVYLSSLGNLCAKGMRDGKSSVDKLAGFFLMEALGDPWGCARCVGEDDGGYSLGRPRAVCP